MTQSKLKQLRWQLSKLLQTRRSIRLGSAWSAVLIAVVSILLVILGLDYLFELSILQRLIVLTIGATVLYWAVIRFALPHLGVKESLLEMALLVERQQGIESDLVGALQFESPEAKQWGSEKLETAVIDYVAELGGDIDVFEGLDTGLFKQRLWYSACVVILAVIVTVASPSAVNVFFQRLFLSNNHYPTTTEITAVEVSGFKLDLNEIANSNVNVGYGQPLKFQVEAEGILPESGRILLTNQNGTKNEIELIASESGEGTYLAELPRLLDPVVYQVYLGDAWTDPAGIDVIPLPILEASIQVTPPTYAANAEPQTTSTNLQASVLQGSQVTLQSSSTKPLKEAFVLLLSGEEAKKIPLVADDSDQLKWKLPETTPPFDSVPEPIRFELHAVDHDGLNPQFPLRGYLRIKADRRPQVSGALVHKVALPTAQPLLDFRVDDDHGIASLSLRIQIERDMISAADKQINILEEVPLRKDQLPFEGQFQLNLSEFQLGKNDRLRMTLEATDYRGNLTGETTLSEPLVLEISDESGVLAAISEADEQSEEQLTEIIKRQLGIGETE